MTCHNHPECRCESDLECIETPRLGCWPAIAAAIVCWLAIAWLFMLLTGASAHEAIPTAAQPEGWSYPYSCCSGVDCRQVEETQRGAALKLFNNKPTVSETREGYKISTTGEVIAFGDSRLKDSPDGEFHWCSVAGANDGRTICLFVPPRSF